MADYRVVCVNHAETSPGHFHIVEVGTGTPSGYTSKLGVATVRIMLGTGHTFFTVGTHSGKRATVSLFDCECGYRSIRSDRDDETDNNLDSLPGCG
jgi:hypothetical protein